MPWTFAHPAAVLPLRSLCPRWLSFPGLVLGAMAPDLTYYVGMHRQWSDFCHTPEGVASVCLPVCLVLLALLLRHAQPLTALLPQPHRRLFRSQLRPLPGPGWVALAVAVVSILLGAATHLVWDAFTHAGRWGAVWLPGLNEPVSAALDRKFRVVNLLQHVSTVVGVAVLALAYRRAAQAQPRVPRRPHDRRRLAVLLACVAGALAVGAASAHALTAPTLPGRASVLLVRTVVWSTSCFAALYVIASAVWWRRWGDA